MWVAESHASRNNAVAKAESDSQRVERGLYDCDKCGTVANADANGAENIRQKSTSESIQDRSNGWLAQPATYSFDATEGRFLPQERVRCEP